MSYKHLAVSKETYNMIVIDCVEEFLRANPDFRDMKISQNYIVARIAKKYLDML